MDAPANAHSTVPPRTNSIFLDCDLPSYLKQIPKAFPYPSSTAWSPKGRNPPPAVRERYHLLQEYLERAPNDLPHEDAIRLAIRNSYQDWRLAVMTPLKPGL